MGKCLLTYWVKLKCKWVIKLFIVDLVDALKAKCDGSWNNLFSIFRFFVLVIFGDEVMKIQKYYRIFVYILHGKMDKKEKKTGKNIVQLKCPKYQKTKDENMGWTKHLCKCIFISDLT